MDSLPKPYFDDGKGIVLYVGDCFELLPLLPKSSLLCTDPPYGIARVWKGGCKHESHGWRKALATDDNRNEWDDKPLGASEIEALLSCAEDAVIWGGNYFPLPLSRGWLVWTKPERNFSLSEAELAWTSRDMPMRVWDGFRSEKDRWHPTQKPLDLMTWCLSFFKDAKTVIDPFSGSGTKLRACKDLGLACVGIEREESYAEKIAKRLEQEAFDFTS